jgi:hypothetical protein
MDEIDSGPCFVFIVGVVLSLETVLLSNLFVSSWIEGHIRPDTSHTRFIFRAAYFRPLGRLGRALCDHPFGCFPILASIN